MRNLPSPGRADGGCCDGGGGCARRVCHRAHPHAHTQPCPNRLPIPHPHSQRPADPSALPVQTPTPSQGGGGGGTTGFSLPGTWLGPYPGSAQSCGSSYSEIHLNGNGTYSTTYESNNCGGLTVYGTYSTQGHTMYVHQQRSDCPTCTQSMSYSVTFSFIDANSLNINGYIYHRQ